MNNLPLASKAKEHWAEWLPDKTAELIADGIFDQVTEWAAIAAEKMIEDLMRAGYGAHEAEEVALREFILLPPEPRADLLDWKSEELASAGHDDCSRQPAFARCEVPTVIACWRRVLATGDVWHLAQRSVIGEREKRPRRRLLAALILAAMFSIAATGAALAASGSLDPTFGVGGIVTTPVPGLSPFAIGAAVQPDGRIVVSAFSQPPGPGIVARYLPNGVLDSSFGGSGLVLGPMGSNYARVGLPPDGKIVVVGGIDGTPAVAIVSRFQANGQADPGFGTAGTVTISGAPINFFANSIVLQPDGRIVVAGSWESDTASNGEGILLVRLNSTGSLDSSFGAGGVARLFQAPMVNTGTLAMALQPDGKFLVAGIVSGRAAVIRLDDKGALDTAFGVGGVAYSPFLHSTFLGVTSRPDGRIVVAGTQFVPNLSNFLAIQFTQDGMLDPGFGAGGVATAALEEMNWGYALCLQPNGKAVVAGNSHSPGGPTDGALVRFDTAGTLDPAFGVNGIVRTHTDQRVDLYAAVCQAGSKVVVAGGVGAVPNSIFLARYDAADPIAEPVPASSDAALLAGMLAIAMIGAIGLRSRQRR